MTNNQKPIPPKKGFRITAFVVGLVSGIFAFFTAIEVHEKIEQASRLLGLATAFGEELDQKEVAELQGLLYAVEFSYLASIALIVGASLSMRSIKGAWVTLASGSALMVLCGIAGWTDALIFAAGGITATVFAFVARRALLKDASPYSTDV